MKVMMIITEQRSNQQLDDSYHQCLALLNFEHQVHVVFVDQAFEGISADSDRLKQWLALKLYGVEAIYQLNFHKQTDYQSATTNCQNIDQSDYQKLIEEMDMLL